MQLVFLGEENFYCITVAYTVMVCLPVIYVAGLSLQYLQRSWFGVTPYRRTVQLTYGLIDRLIDGLCDRRTCTYDGLTVRHVDRLIDRLLGLAG